MVARGDYDAAATLLSDLELPDGNKQIALIQLGNCFARMKMRGSAMAAYHDAIRSERSWGKRQDPEVSSYILSYVSTAE